MNEYPDIIPIRDADFGFPFWPWSKGPLWRLNNHYLFTVNKDTFYHEYVIPKGYEFDGQSVPAVLHGPPFNYGPSGVGMRAGLIHDFLCDIYQGGSEWLQRTLVKIPLAPPAAIIHEVYYDIQLADNQRKTKAGVSWWAVDKFGPGGKLRPKFLDKRRTK